jgi:hypothetical protein
MAIDRKVLDEIKRYRSIDKYITEQAAPPPPLDPNSPEGDTPAGEVSPIPPSTGGVPSPSEAPAPPSEPSIIDVDADEDVEKIDSKGKSEEGEDSEELDVTDLVDSQKNIEKKQDDYFENLFGQLSKLESKLSEMDSIMSKLNSLESKIEKYREKTPQEKLELRTYDSYPFNQKLSDFFEDKKEDMEKTGKNDYVLTPDDVTDINPEEIKGTFQPTKEPDNNFGR